MPMAGKARKQAYPLIKKYGVKFAKLVPISFMVVHN